MDLRLESVLKKHAKIMGFADVEEFETMMAEFDKESKKHKKGTKKHKQLQDWKSLDGSKEGLRKALGK